MRYKLIYLILMMMSGIAVQSKRNQQAGLTFVQVRLSRSLGILGYPKMHQSTENVTWADLLATVIKKEQVPEVKQEEEEVTIRLHGINQ